MLTIRVDLLARYMKRGKPLLYTALTLLNFHLSIFYNGLFLGLTALESDLLATEK